MLIPAMPAAEVVETIVAAERAGVDYCLLADEALSTDVYAALGAAAGILASAGASVLAAVLATQLFDLPYTFNPLLWVAGVAAGLFVVSLVASGLFYWVQTTRESAP